MSSGAGASATYSDAVLDLAGGYNPGTNLAGGAVTVTNGIGGVYSGSAGGWRGFVYQATGDGPVTVSVNYSLSGSISTDGLNEFSTAG